MVQASASKRGSHSRRESWIRMYKGVSDTFIFQRIEFYCHPDL